MEDFKVLNEKLEKLLETNEYELAIIEGRARDLHGNLEKHKFTAKNDLDAMIQIFKKYDLQNSYYFTETTEDLEEEYGEEYVEKRDAVLKCLEENKIDEGVKLITEIYYDDFDPSDYYDNIIKLTAPDGHIVFEDDGESGLYDDEQAFLDSDDEEWDDDEDL